MLGSLLPRGAAALVLSLALWSPLRPVESWSPVLPRARRLRSHSGYAQGRIEVMAGASTVEEGDLPNEAGAYYGGDRGSPDGGGGVGGADCGRDPNVVLTNWVDELEVFSAEATADSDASGRDLAQPADAGRLRRHCKWLWEVLSADGRLSHLDADGLASVQRALAMRVAQVSQHTHAAAARDDAVRSRPPRLASLRPDLPVLSRSLNLSFYPMAAVGGAGRAGRPAE